MIPGLDISEEVEERIWSAFDRWSDRFKSRLAEEGVPNLIDRYRRVVESVETQSCPHGLDGSLNTGRHWQFCCGITYKFDAEMQCRRALRFLLEVAPPEATSGLRQVVAALDDRLYALYEDPPGRTGDWWERAYPRGVIDTSLAGDWVRLPPDNPPGEGVDVLSLRRDGTFKGRFAVHRSILNGKGTYTVRLDRRIEFTRGSVTVSMPFLFKVDELILEWKYGRLLRFFYRGEPIEPELDPVSRNVS